MVFLYYNARNKNCEYWVTKEKYARINEYKNARARIVTKTDEVKKKRNEYEKKRKANDIVFRISCSTRALIRACIKNNGFKKKSKTANILGCSFEEFKTHLESQFLPGMSWDNQGEWHIDHIMPVSMAKTYDEVVRLNHYKNLRPLWAADNHRKSDKIGDTLVLF